MKNKKGFTLIELLAVIIILGILMLVAIPSVTTYINNSRKNTYVDTINSFIKGTVVKVNSGELEMFDTDTTYYIPVSAIKLENGDAQSPYGALDDAYVVVTYDGDDYDYYFVGKDEKNMGIEEITKGENITKDSIKEVDSVDKTVGIEGKSKIVIFDDELNPGEAQPAMNSVSGGGSSGSSLGGELNTSMCERNDCICKRATTLHTATCNRTDSYGCKANSTTRTTITYGSLGTSGTLTSGDAFDCDVNDDGTFDPVTERFYYVTSTGTGANEVATLIYYTNVTGGTTATSTQTHAYFASTRLNSKGPETAAAQLPSTTQWSNFQIIVPGIRQITNQNGGTTTNNGSSTITNYFTGYNGKAARLLTTQELVSACGLSKVGNFITGELDNCNFLLENVSQYETSSGPYGYWLENPLETSWSNVWCVGGDGRSVGNLVSDANYGVRPVITVLTSNISN